MNPASATPLSCSHIQKPAPPPLSSSKLKEGKSHGFDVGVPCSLQRHGAGVHSVTQAFPPHARPFCLWYSAASFAVAAKSRVSLSKWRKRECTRNPGSGRFIATATSCARFGAGKLSHKGENSHSIRNYARIWTIYLSLPLAAVLPRNFTRSTPPASKYRRRHV